MCVDTWRWQPRIRTATRPDARQRRHLRALTRARPRTAPAGAPGATPARRLVRREHPQLAERHRALLGRFADQPRELDARQPGGADLLDLEQLGVQRDHVGAGRGAGAVVSTGSSSSSISGVVRWPSACTSPASHAACRRRKRARAASSTCAPSNAACAGNACARARRSATARRARPHRRRGHVGDAEQAAPRRVAGASATRRPSGSGPRR